MHLIISSAILKIENKINNLTSCEPKNVILYLSLICLIFCGFTCLHVPRSFCLLFLMLFFLWLYKNYSRVRIQAAPELKERVQALQQRLVAFKQTKPAIFCAVASGCLALLAVVGHLVSSSSMVLCGLGIATIISTKYNFTIMKIERPDSNIDWSEKLQQECELDEEFMPEENETNMFVLERASDLASLTLPTDDGENDEDKSDEVPSELLIPDSIPEIDENSTDDDQDDLLPVVPVSKSESHIKKSIPATDALVKYSQSNDTIEFKKSYFKRDSSLSDTSSSSEESLSKGLQFPDHTAIDGPTKSGSTTTRSITSSQQDANDLVAMAVKSQTQALLSNSSKLIPSLVSGLVQGVLRAGAAAGVGVGGRTLTTESGHKHDDTNRRIVTALDSSDESDFEILEQEDFQ